MAAGSYLRYITGILLSLDVVRLYITNGRIEFTTILLAFVFLVLAAMYIVRKF